MSDHFKGWQDGHLPPPEIPEQEPAEQIKEGGGQVLDIGAIADGEYLLRSGTDILSNDLISYIAGEVSPVKIVSIKSAVFTGTQTASVAGGGAADITSLSISHGVTKSTNRLILLAFVGMMGHSNNFGSSSISIAYGSTGINIATSPSSRTPSNSAGVPSGTAATYITIPISAGVVYSPGTTSSRTYKVRMNNLATANSTLYINRTPADTNNAGFPRASSSLILIEVE